MLGRVGFGKFHGALFYTASITVTGVNYLKWVGIGATVVVGILIGVAYVRYRRTKTADADAVRKKQGATGGTTDENEGK